MKTRLANWLLICCCLFSSGYLSAQPVSVLERISIQLVDADTISGEFSQQRFLQVLSQPLTSSGEFVFDRKLGVRWHIQQPFESIMTVDNLGIHYEGESAQPSVTDFGQLLLAMLSLDIHLLQEKFDITGELTDSSWQLTLKPKQQLWREAIREVRLFGVHVAERVEVLEASSDKVIITFSNIQFQSAEPQPQQEDPEKSAQ